MPLALVELVITGTPGTTLVTVRTMPLGLVSERTVKPELLIVEKFPLSEPLVMIANVCPTVGL